MSPYSVRRALENTSVPLGDLPEDKLSTGQGLMQVDKLDSLLWPFFYFISWKLTESYVVNDLFTEIACRAHEYLQQARSFPSVWYQVKINRSGKTG